MNARAFCLAAALLTAGCAGTASSNLTPPAASPANGTAAIFVANVRLSNVMRFPPNANGPAAPTLTVQGGLTPNALAFDSAGNFYVAGSNNAISVYAPFASQAFKTISNAQICRLGGIAVDAAGAVYAADPICDQLVKLTPQSGGTYSLAWVIAGAHTKLSGPSSVAVDQSGDVFALDQPNAVNTSPPAVTEYDPSGASGQSDLAPIATISGGSFPTGARGLGVDATGDVFVASAAQIQEYVSDSSGYHLSGTIDDSNLCSIASIAIGTDTKENYVLAANACGPKSAGNGTLAMFDVTTPLAGSQDPTPLIVAGSAAEMNVTPGSAAAFDSSGISGNRAYVGNPLIDTITGYCLCSSSGPAQYQLSTGYPGLDGVQAIWFSGARMYSSDGAAPAISLYDQFPQSAAAPLMPAPLWRILGSNTRLCGPASVVTDRLGNVYVDNDCSSNGGGANSNTLARFDAPPASSNGNLNLAPAWITAAAACPNPSRADVLCNPQQLAIDGLGNVYVTNYGGNSIVEYTSGGNQVAVLTAEPAVLHRPSGIAIDSGGNLVVYSDAENDAGGDFPGLIAYFSKPAGTGNVVLTASKTIAGTGTTLPASQFGQIALDAGGNLFVNLFKSIAVYAPDAKASDAPAAAIALPAGAGGTGLAIAPAP
ncbi:MAG TPA: hypothetical protein VFW34_05730 [Candidatus Rubrimentiphilum sp.]|nr:hypothetical protein [Candidatus Rubrimentiphilum sp.]